MIKMRSSLLLSALTLGVMLSAAPVFAAETTPAPAAATADTHKGDATHHHRHHHHHHCVGAQKNKSAK